MFFISAFHFFSLFLHELLGQFSKKVELLKYICKPEEVSNSDHKFSSENLFEFVICHFDVCRTKDVDWMPFFSQRLVDDFASHLRLYRRARENATVPPTDGK